MKRLMHRPNRRVPGGEPGAAAIYLLLALALATMFWGVFYESMRGVQDAIHYSRSLVAYYAAEAGLEKALSLIEQGFDAPQTLHGRAGAGVYETSITYNGERVEIHSRGYFKPKKPEGNDRPEGGEQKNIIKYTGRIVWSRVVKENWESYP